jgi:hypothetical protein
MQQVLCSDCPKCGHENYVNSGTSHKNNSEADTFTVKCRGCHESYDTSGEDMVFRDKSETEIARMGPVTTGSWV